MTILTFLLKHSMTQMREHYFLQIVCTDLNCPDSKKCNFIDFTELHLFMSELCLAVQIANSDKWYNSNITSVCKLCILFGFNPVRNPRLQKNTNEKASSLLTNATWA